MRITNLSKTINLFITGSFITFSTILIFYSKFSFLLKNESIKFSTFTNVIIGVSAFAMIVFIGTIIEGLSDIIRELFRFLLRKTNGYTLLFKLMYNQKSFYQYNSAKTRFLNLVKTYQISEFEDINNELDESLGTLLLFTKSKEIYTNWIVSHYASYLLFSNFIIVVSLNSISLIYIIPKNFFPLFTIIITFVIIIYILLRFALDKYLYAYTHLYLYAGNQVLTMKQSDESTSLGAIN